MKAAIVNPYLDTLGGGEKYTSMVEKTLLESGYKVNIEWSDPGIIKKLEERFGLDLKGLSIVKEESLMIFVSGFRTVAYPH